MTITAITPEVSALANAERSTALAIRAATHEIVILDENDEINRARELQALHAKTKQLEDARMRIKRPLLDAGKAVDDLFREPIALVNAAKDAVSRALGAYRQEQQRQKDALLAAAPAAATAAESRALISAGTEEAIKIGGTRETVSFEIVITNAALVPREFCEPSEALARAAAVQADKNGTAIQIPGMTITRVVKVVPTGR